MRDNDQASNNDSSSYPRPPPYNPHYREEEPSEEENVDHDRREEVEMSLEELREARLRRLSNPAASRVRRRVT